jgi:hypothetical protein
MALMQLPSLAATEFARIPEIGMGFQIGRILGKSSTELLRVIGAAVAIKWDARASEQLEEVLRRPWMDPLRSRADQEENFLIWLHDLDDSPPIEPAPTDIARAAAAFILFGMVGPISSPPPSPVTVYGHLPFHGQTGPEDVYYRYEPFPVSRRIDQKKRNIAADTYATPASELPFMPSGFSAVAFSPIPAQPTSGGSARPGSRSRIPRHRA